MEPSRVRIADIAEEQGLSTATVSNVIHGKTKKISQETVKRVQELLEKRQYIPSMAGILLAQNDSRIIGVVVNDHEKYEDHAMEDGFIGASLNALTKELDKAGYFLMLKLTKDSEEIPRFASMWNMEGVILMGFCERDYKKMREKMHIPMVIYDGFLPEQGNFVNIELNHFDGGVKAGQYLLSKGHKKVLCISDNNICMDSLRFQGLKSIIPQAQLRLVPSNTQERRLFYEKQIEELLEYTAVFAVSDFYAIDLLQFLQDHKIGVPDRISILGFDDIREGVHSNPPLSTIGQNHEMRAKTALEMLKKQKETGNHYETVCLPVAVVERASVKDLSKE